MNIWNPGALILFILFVIPGFVAIKTYLLFEPATKAPAWDSVIDAIAYSCINYAVWLVPILWAAPKRSWWFSWPGGVVALLVLLVSPVALATGWWALRNGRLLRSLVPHPTGKPWDYIFGSNDGFWVKVTLKNGDKIGGLFWSGSFASSTPNLESLYLEQAWELDDDGDFHREIPYTKGVLIMEGEMSTIEFFKGEGELSHE